MNYAVAIALLLLVGLLTLVSYVERVYNEIGKFLSREFQDNIDVFEQSVEPRLRIGRERASMSMAVLAQLITAAIAMLIGPHMISALSRYQEYRGGAASHVEPCTHRACLQPVSSVCVLFPHDGKMAHSLGFAPAIAHLPDATRYAGSGLSALRHYAY